MKLIHIKSLEQFFMCDAPSDDWGEHRHTALPRTTSFLQILPSQGTPESGKQRAWLFQVNVKSQYPTKFMNTNCCQQVSKQHGGKKTCLFLLLSTFLKKKKKKSYECS